MNRKGKLLKMAAMLLLTVLFCAATVHAQEEQENPNQLTLTLEIDGQPALVDDGKAEAELPDGTTVTVEGENLPDGLVLMVKMVGVDDGDILAWIEKCMKGKGTKLRAYDIYFVDSNGKRYELTETINITISLNGEYARPAVYYVALDGHTELMKGTVKNDRISFVTSHNSYYALVEQEEDFKEEETTPTPTPGTSGNNSGTGNGTGGTSGSGTTQGTGAKTGDETNLAGLLAMLLLSGIAVLGFTAKSVYQKRR